MHLQQQKENKEYNEKSLTQHTKQSTLIQCFSTIYYLSQLLVPHIDDWHQNGVLNCMADGPYIFTMWAR